VPGLAEKYSGRFCRGCFVLVRMTDQGRHAKIVFDLSNGKYLHYNGQRLSDHYPVNLLKKLFKAVKPFFTRLARGEL
jgi:hypothetical protein